PCRLPELVPLRSWCRGAQSRLRGGGRGAQPADDADTLEVVVFGHGDAFATRPPRALCARAGTVPCRAHITRRRALSTARTRRGQSTPLPPGYPQSRCATAAPLPVTATRAYGSGSARLENWCERPVCSRAGSARSVRVKRGGRREKRVPQRPPRRWDPPSAARAAVEARCTGRAIRDTPRACQGAPRPRWRP